MKNFLEKTSLLSLSLMMITPFSVSPALPKMLSYYQKLGYSSNQVTILFSLSSFAILATLLVNPIINRYLKEKTIIILALLLIAFGGATPLLIQSYYPVFFSRLFLGAGIGLINAKAINMMSERFSGKERIKMLGYRSSAEVLGSAILTFCAGYLITFGWTKAFLIYAFALIILLMYLLFVPDLAKEIPEDSKPIKADKLRFKQLLILLGMATYAGFVIVVNTSNTLRIPVVIDQFKIGSAAQSSFILSLMMLMGIVSGISFSYLLDWLHSYLMPAIAISLGLGMLILWQGTNLFLVGLGAILTGFVYSIGVTIVFHNLSEIVPSHQLTTATTLVLIGCNIGGGGAAIILQFLSSISKSLMTPYLIYALMSLGLGLLMLVFTLSKKLIKPAR
ncbi:MFS transporter [Streptococcus catagoni]|uniref:MFS transporter n=1 Tax=Streptococcus catagoni TaxID=2654874 RepID=UPI00140B9E8A|nr:MFS transporter [Streptococcus catagoni]